MAPVIPPLLAAGAAEVSGASLAPVAAGGAGSGIAASVAYWGRSIASSSAVTWLVDFMRKNPRLTEFAFSGLVVKLITWIASHLKHPSINTAAVTATLAERFPSVKWSSDPAELNKQIAQYVQKNGTAGAVGIVRALADSGFQFSLPQSVIQYLLDQPGYDDKRGALLAMFSAAADGTLTAEDNTPVTPGEIRAKTEILLEALRFMPGGLRGFRALRRSLTLRERDLQLIEDNAEQFGYRL